MCLENLSDKELIEEMKSEFTKLELSPSYREEEEFCGSPKNIKNLRSCLNNKNLMQEGISRGFAYTFYDCAYIHSRIGRLMSELSKRCKQRE